ncbi:transmembrane protein 70, mitochondrial isoform X2 [Notolabrus celidotus]|uniref:transmembrane protein 70, mitochondrial isoform X2 n=1 Tax=Notolabrus celidotus TaxID=1203425 RepID=UPI00148FD83E|nr:transmembrane protein 70, mitochondrial isoform X2 [Notolabrus celidotus]
MCRNLPLYGKKKKKKGGSPCCLVELSDRAGFSDRLNMLSVNTLRRFRPCALSRAVNFTLTSRLGAPPLSACCVRGERQLHAGRRSILVSNNKVQSLCPSIIRCVSTATPSTDGQLVYIGNLGSAVRGVKTFSYTTSGASLIILPQILLKTGLGVQSFALQAAFCGVIGFFTFLTPVLLHVLTKGYVARLYHHPDTDTYTAVTYSVFLTEKKNVFHQDQVRVPAVSKMFTTFYAGNSGLLVNPDLFLTPQDYNHLMGYDKPFSFHPEDMNRPEDS